MSFSPSRIAGNLWVGNFPGYYNTGQLRGVDLVVFMAQEAQPWDPKMFAPTKVVQAGIDDNPDRITRSDAKRIFGAARMARTFLDSGKVVLSTCAMGLNRSAVAAALALMLPSMGPTPKAPYCLSSKQAIALVRHARGAKALGNPQFVRLLKEFDGVCRAASVAA